MTESSQQERAGGSDGAHGASGPPKHQRKLRNYLLDKRFQLKYTGIVIGITTFLSLILGYYLNQEIVTSQETILARDLGGDASLIEPGDIDQYNKVSDSILRAFNDGIENKLSVVVKVNNAPAGTTLDLYEDAFRQELTQKRSVLIGALGVFLLVLALVWVFLTHKIAGPIYKLKLLFSKVEGDRLRVAGRLRKGDELQDTFVAFMDMIQRLRDHRATQANRLAGLIEKLEKNPDSRQEVLESLHDIQSRMTASLDD